MKLDYFPLDKQSEQEIANYLNNKSSWDNAFSHPKFSILDWETCNGRWRRCKRWIDDTKELPTTLLKNLALRIC